ncbi:MAG: Phosphoesterase RecJ domain protein [Candidatus Woesebacteria bacterium GW2011_GWA1_41_7]|uniref:Phosphoesterase RecJ domain protein n=2 Tax=Candidatus Woeseibacteriota TaxID=1752722 RepID=A0A0G0Z3F9_9BACT|nr:MAG: Phosphoesterase RecJ domain protein [Candidatus Woesebacteria bacterium GW2011_GWE1_41_24]KKS16581.1 MAG: Phosphoesterase RecJ domain protein [Candidatus Woesebacteria bacterium GW2011_GWA1_41_7]
MNYKDSPIILSEIKKAPKILVNCHRGPDSDSIGSALAMAKVIQKIGGQVTVICPSDIPSDLMFLPGADEIIRVNYTSFDFSSYDLFMILDSSTYSMVTGLKDSDKPGIRSIVIDHHFSNEKFGDINLVDSEVTSTGELLYGLFLDWDVTISGDTANCLLTGIIGDTGTFQYQNVGEKTLRIAADLIEKGANKDEIVFNLYRNIEFREVKMWGKFIERMMIEDGFVWSAIPLPIYRDLGEYTYAKEDVANFFAPIVKGTEFGIVMVEVSENVLSVSFRSRTGFDVAKVAAEIGGGGHKAAAGARIEGLPFQEAVNEVLKAARKHVQKD